MFCVLESLMCRPFCIIIISQLHTVRANAVLPRQELGAHGMDDMIKME